ncbi:MAG TPA: SHOCT domain-containing protein [Candidatus Limnocylindria bacterium]|nr:SHOCT domain-containing protein [Candidatus Limnocylindria bacterium]
MNDIDLATIATALWIAVTVAAVIAAARLIVTFARIERRARRVLEDRLASGEIDIDDYRRRIALLGD